MGNTNADGLRFMQLNYYSHINNPLEFYSENNHYELEKQSACFKAALKKELHLSEEELKTFEWNIGDIDKRVQKERYSLLYRQDVCYTEDENKPNSLRLLSREEFQKKWVENFEKFIRLSEEEEKTQEKERERQACSQSPEKKKDFEKTSDFKSQTKNSFDTVKQKDSQAINLLSSEEASESTRKKKAKRESGDPNQMTSTFNTKNSMTSQADNSGHSVDTLLKKVSMSKTSKNVFNRQHLINCMVFDCMCYLAWLQHFFEKTNISKLTSTDADRFASQLRTLHDNKITSQMKVTKLLQHIRDYSINVVFLQQITRSDVAMLRKEMQDVFGQTCHYTIVENQSSSIIIYNHLKLSGKRDQEFESKHKSGLQENRGSVMCKVGRVILISSHLSSRPKESKIQAGRLLSQIDKMMAPTSSDPNKVFLMGINSNYFIEEEQFKIFPDRPDIHTSKKKRSFFQPQVGKGDTAVEETKDHLMSSMTLLDCMVGKIDGSEIKPESFLPSRDHPYPNFVLHGVIKV